MCLNLVIFLCEWACRFVGQIFLPSSQLHFLRTLLTTLLSRKAKRQRLTTLLSSANNLNLLSKRLRAWKFRAELVPSSPGCQSYLLSLHPFTLNHRPRLHEFDHC